jgi:hypothetical protein
MSSRHPCDNGTYLEATAFLEAALRFFFALFLPADFAFRVRIAAFCIELLLVGIAFFLPWGFDFLSTLRNLIVNDLDF